MKIDSHLDNNSSGALLHGPLRPLLLPGCRHTRKPLPSQFSVVMPCATSMAASRQVRGDMQCHPSQSSFRSIETDLAPGSWWWHVVVIQPEGRRVLSNRPCTACRLARSLDPNNSSSCSFLLNSLFLSWMSNFHFRSANLERKAQPHSRLLSTFVMPAQGQKKEQLHLG